MDKELLSKLKHIEVVKNEFLQPMWDNWYHYINNDKEEVKKMKKEAFIFDYIKPVLDWYETIKVEIKPDDFVYFHLERRFGPSWWLTGGKPVDKPKYHWEYKELGEIDNHDLKRFIEWAKTENGSKITQINVISGDFDIFKEIEKILK